MFMCRASNGRRTMSQSKVQCFISNTFIIFLNTGCHVGWAGLVVKEGHQFLLLLSVPPKSWNYRCAQPQIVPGQPGLHSETHLKKKKKEGKKGHLQLGMVVPIAHLSIFRMQVHENIRSYTASSEPVRASSYCLQKKKRRKERKKTHCKTASLSCSFCESERNELPHS